jgi:phenylacetate-CoA ligase
LNAEFGITEILDPDHEPIAPGHEGHLVGTSLHNYAMPLLRYVTNDISAVRPRLCSCGRSSPLMDDVATKAEDIITLPDGRLMSPSVLTHPFKPMHSVEASQIVQEDRSSILIKVVPGVDYVPADSEYLVREFRARMGDDVKIEVQLVDELGRTASGKFKWVISKVALGV